MRAINRTNGGVLMDNGSMATSLWARTVGLMGRSGLPEGSGLVLVGDNAIHTFFMRFPIDVLFLDQQGAVLHKVEQMPPWRISPIVWGARYILELPPKTISRTGSELGHIISLAD